MQIDVQKQMATTQRALGSYWRYSYQPPQVPHTELELATQAVDYILIGRARPEEQDRDYDVLFTLYQTKRYPLPMLSLGAADVIWDGKIYPGIELPAPIAVGQQITRTYEVPLEDETIEITINARVLSLELLMVPAGTFAAFHIQYEENGVPYADLWYSEAVQSFIRRESRMSPLTPKVCGPFLFPYLFGLIGGTLVLEHAERLSESAALEMMFQRLREISESRPDLVLMALQQLIKLGIAREEAQTLMREILRSNG